MTDIKHRKDYTPSSHCIDTVNLHFDLHPTQTTVLSVLAVRKNPNAKTTNRLKLDGQHLELLEVGINGTPLKPSQYKLTEHFLEFECDLESFECSIKTKIDPANNTSLSGLYLSSGNFCTQCEAQGFRKITYFLDRPDVLSKYTVTISADKEHFPILLSNGNPTEKGTLEDNRHFATWNDPFPKPSYLFALVAGNLSVLEDSFTTKSGRHVDLQIYVQPQYLDQCDYAMQALKDSMTWDEERFGLEYDLDVYMIVAVDDFNMGAMENKGLNVFNTKYVLGNDTTGTDQDFEGIQSVIGHEYFHNWTGNRVTCRDWFQLSLKEGLTVFRDQEFSADLGDRTVKRIEDIRVLKDQQFPEDAGPMAHPIRPDTYVQIDNFYTATVYEKGAEVIRMIHTLIGEELFQKGMRLYFERHDGSAVTCEDFVVAMEDASKHSLKAFRTWYEQAGTPTLEIQTTYNQQSQELTIDFTQRHPASIDQTTTKPFVLPIRFGLLDEHGSPISFSIGDETSTQEKVLVLDQAKETVVCNGIKSHPIPSFNRGFSAPIHVKEEQAPKHLAILMQHDPDLYNRWDASQKLAKQAIKEIYSKPPRVAVQKFYESYKKLCLDHTLPPGLKALMLQLPSIQSCIELLPTFDVEGMVVARTQLATQLATDNQTELLGLFKQTTTDPKAVSSDLRRLSNTALHALTYAPISSWLERAEDHYKNASNMTDRLAALQAIMSTPNSAQKQVLDNFYTSWKEYPLLINKWFAIQSSSRSEETFERVQRLETHPDFHFKKPNKVRALYGAFAMRNLGQFHKANGKGYTLVANAIKNIDPINPQVASSLAKSFRAINSMPSSTKSMMMESLQSIKAQKGLSKNTLEIVNRFIESSPT